MTTLYLGIKKFTASLKLSSHIFPSIELCELVESRCANSCHLCISVIVLDTISTLILNAVPGASFPPAT